MLIFPASTGCADQELAIWIRLPQVSSRTAVVTRPICAGSCVKVTPRSRRRAASACTSGTAKDGILEDRQVLGDGLPARAQRVPGGQAGAELEEGLAVPL